MIELTQDGYHALMGVATRALGENLALAGALRRIGGADADTLVCGTAVEMHSIARTALLNPNADADALVAVVKAAIAKRDAEYTFLAAVANLPPPDADAGRHIVRQLREANEGVTTAVDALPPHLRAWFGGAP